MKRRDFVKSSVAVAGGLVMAQSAPVQAQDKRIEREFYELRVYHLRRGPMQKRFDDFMRDAALPALNRAGIKPVGVFGVLAGPSSPSVYVLLPHKSIDSVATLSDRLRGDPDFKGGNEFIEAPATDPSYVRMESALMIAFDGMPRLETPSATAEKKPRVFELRTYESHSHKAHLKKVEMFNQGEIAIFRRTGLTPVFFGSTLVGRNMPNLTYMLVFESLAQREKNWGVFAGDPEWKKLSATPGYTDPEIVSNIRSLFLRPMAYSQI